jgi:hypothetical protein
VNRSEAPPAWIGRVYRAASLSNAAVTVPAFIAYRRYVGAFGVEKPNYPFLVKIWSGMALLWGVSFWEIARDPERAYPLVKYSYLEKAMTSGCVLAAWRRGEVPTKVARFVAASDVVWIPIFAAAHYRLAPSRSLDTRRVGGTHAR